jgi:hypothetical protein
MNAISANQHLTLNQQYPVVFGHKVNVSPSQRHLPFSQALDLLLKHYQMNVFPLNEKFPFTIRGPIMQHLSASIISSLLFSCDY